MENTLDAYRVFAQAARSGSLSSAARELYITQPAVSQTISRLEDSLGARLFDRTARGVTLTVQGEMLYGYVQAALGLVSAGEEKLHDLGTLQSGHLSIGAGDTATKGLLLPCLERFHALYPKVSIGITNRTSRETLDLLKEGQIDVGFVNLPISAEGIAFSPCMEIHDVFVAGEAFAPGLRGKKVSLRQLRDYPLIMLERTSNSRRRNDAFFLQQGTPLSPAIELGSHALLPDCARIGLGLACVTREFTDMTGLFEIDLEVPLPARSIGVCTLEGIAPSEAADRFIRTVHEYAQEKA